MAMDFALARKWQIILVVAFLVGALVMVAPRYTPDGWQTNIP